MPRDLRGEIDDFEDDLYVTTADGKTARRRLTEGGGFRSPVFAPDDQHVLALCGAPRDFTARRWW